MNFIKVVFFIVFCLIPVYATVYEDAEDKKRSRWKVIDKVFNASIHNHYDKQKKSRIIELKGQGTRSSFKFQFKKIRKNGYFLSWEMKYSEDFVIIVSLDTKKGKRYLIYTPGDNDSYMQYGLGVNATDGEWHTYRRNLEEDLIYFDNRDKIEKITTFIVKGSGSIDNIKVMKKDITLKKFQIKKIPKRNLYNTPVLENTMKIKKHKTNTTPQITIEGENPFYLKIGEPYVELGVTAHDKEDGRLNVTSSETINIYKNGRYSVLYIVTDSDGNAALDRRYVEVGTGRRDTVKMNSEENNERISKIENYEIRHEEKEYEMGIRERELELREYELQKREVKLQNKNK